METNAYRELRELLKRNFNIQEMSIDVPPTPAFDRLESDIIKWAEKLIPPTLTPDENPWFDFLLVRIKAMAYMRDVRGYSNEEILESMTMDLEQVRMLLAGEDHCRKLAAAEAAGIKLPIHQITPDKSPIFEVRDEP